MSFFRETLTKATRKQHHCEHCGGKIEIGSPAVYMASLTEDGDFFSCRGHVECREAEVDWNSERGTSYEDFDWLWSIKDDDEAEDWAVWLREKHPVAAARIYGTGGGE